MKIVELNDLAIGKTFSCVENCPDDLRIANTNWMKIAPVCDNYGNFLGYRCIELTTDCKHILLDEEIFPADLRVEV